MVTILILIEGVLLLAGAATALRVLHERRSPEGTLAWILSLIVLPFFAVPAYWLLGSHRDLGRRTRLGATVGGLHADRPLAELQDRFPVAGDLRQPGLEALTPFPFLGGHAVSLLADGEAAFASFREAITSARHYLLVECYTIARDDTGRQFLDWLGEAAERGVRVFLLYDAWGSYALDRHRRADLQRRGIEAHAFRFGRGGLARPKLNFRNHRKIVVVDGKVGFVGGMNIANAYVCRHRRLAPWRDTHVRLEGPAVLMLQRIFVGDWECSSETAVNGLYWHPRKAGEAVCAVLPTGPVEPGDEATMLLQELARQARSRLLIATPYLIPTDAVVAILRGAVLRGVEVSILTTGQRDHHTSFQAGFFFARQLRDAGVRVLRYRDGFLHEKVILVDDRIAAIGSMNLDHRSLKLNFEVTALFLDPATVGAVAGMLGEDLSRSLDSAGEWERLGAGRRLLACLARLLGPLL